MMLATPAWPIVAVLDTNVVIAGLLWEGPPRSLLAQATEGDDLILAQPKGTQLFSSAYGPSGPHSAIPNSSTPGWTRTSGLAFRRRDPFGPRSATGSPTEVRPAGLEPATLGLEIPCSIHLSYGRVSLRTFSTTGPRGAQQGTQSVACGTGCAGGPYSLACAAGLDEEGFPCKPDARARESVLHAQRNHDQRSSASPSRGRSVATNESTATAATKGSVCAAFIANSIEPTKGPRIRPRDAND